MNKECTPPMGIISEMSHQRVSIHELAEKLEVSHYELADALNEAGYKLVPDSSGIMPTLALIILKESANIPALPITDADVIQIRRKKDE